MNQQDTTGALASGGRYRVTSYMVEITDPSGGIAATIDVNDIVSVQRLANTVTLRQRTGGDVTITAASLDDAGRLEIALRMSVPATAVPTATGRGVATSLNPIASTTLKTPEERKQLLAGAINTLLAQGNRRVESTSDFSAVLIQGKPVNHILHLLIAIFTCGIWALVWLVMGITGGEKREMVTVDDYGNTAVQRLT